VSSAKILVAGAGNIFLGDDAFGVEVVRVIQAKGGIPGCEVVDIGIRGVHLAFQLVNSYDGLVLIDTAARGEVPGTVSLVEIDLTGEFALEDGQYEAEDGLGDGFLIDAHSMGPDAVVSTIRQIGSELGSQLKRALLVACEPESLAEGIGLSPVVAGAIEAAADLTYQAVAILAAEPAAAGASSGNSDQGG
jgi:hydrogenase maturation protease